MSPAAPVRGAAAAGRRLAFNAGARAVTEVLVKLASTVLFAVLARTVGPEPLGRFAFALAITQFIWAFASLGLDRMAVRDMARDHDAIHRLFWDTLAIKVTVTALATAAVVGVLALVGRSDETILLVAILGFDVCLAFAVASAQAVFQAHERLGAFFFVAVPTGVLNAALGLTALALGGGVVEVVLCTTVAQFVGMGLGLALVFRNFARPKLRIRPRRWPGLVREALPFGVQEMLGQFIFRFDTLLLGVIAVSAVVGHYSAAYRILEATLFLAWSIGASALPQFSYLKRRSESDGGASVEDAFEGSLKLLLIAMVPIATTLLVCAESIITTLYGDGFLPSVEILRLLACAVLLYGVAHVVGLLVLVRRPARISILYSAAIATANVVTCAILIPLLGAPGAAISTLSAELLLAVVGLVLVLPAIARPNVRRIALSPFVAAAAMAAAMLPLADELLLALPAGGLVYLAVLLAFEGRGLKAQLAALRPV